MHTLKYLRDPANGITMLGLFAAMIGIVLAIHGAAGLAVATVLWSVIADHLDGFVAKRTRGRPLATAEMGKNLDAFADLLSGCVFPAILLLSIAPASVLSLATALLLVGIGALRLGIFNAEDHSDQYNVGLPIIYNVPFLAVSLVLSGWFSIPQPLVVQTVLIICLCLHFTSIPVPRVRGLGYPAIFAICAGASGLLMTSATSFG